MSDADKSGAGAASMTRRHFLRLTALAGGGLLIGCGASDPLAPGTDGPAAEPGQGVALGDFLRIDADNRVTVLVGATEIGQGILTGLAMVVAEELDADWSKVRAEHSPVASVYANPYFFGFVQGTLSSSSMRGYFQPQREVGAIVRRLLVETAAAQWGLPADGLLTQDSHVIDPDSGRRLSYGELAPHAAGRRPPRSAATKSPEQFRIVGTSRQRLDAVAQVEGRREYGMDVELPGMLTAVLLRPPRFGGQAVSYDDREAMAVPGVREVHRTTAGIAVVADNFWAAQQGRKALSVTWSEVLGGRTDSAAQRRLYETLLDLPGVPVRNDGEATSAELSADETLRADYFFPFQAHAAMEPLNVVVDYDGRRARIWTGTQSPTLDRVFAAAVLGLLPAQVEFHTLPAGGGFGRRGSWLADFVRDACEVARQVRRPVKLVWSREDDMRGGYYRPMAATRMSASIGGDRITAWTHRSVVQDITALAAVEHLIDTATALNNGVRPQPATDLLRFDSNFLYAVDNVRMDLRLDAKPEMPALYMRAVNKVTDIFAQEAFFDVVARRLGREPYAYRRELLADQPRHLAVLDAVTRAAGWDAPLPAADPPQGRRGRGIAVLGHWGSVVAQVVELTVTADKGIRLHRVVSAVDCGTVVNPDLVRAQIESAVVFALSSLFYGEITLVDGVVQQGNYDDYRVLRMFETPQIETVLVDSDGPPGGVGELGVPCVGPALVNAILAATGESPRELPLRRLGYHLLEQHPAAGVDA